MTDRELPNLIEGIMEAFREAEKMEIKANMVFINDRLAFSRLKTDCFDVPIICGLKAAYTTELPDDVLFAVTKVDSPLKTKDERIFELEEENKELREKFAAAVREINRIFMGGSYDR